DPRHTQTRAPVVLIPMPLHPASFLSESPVRSHFGEDLPRLSGALLFANLRSGPGVTISQPARGGLPPGCPQKLTEVLFWRVRLLPRLVPEAQTRGVFGYGTLDLVRDSVRVIGGNLHGHFHARLSIAGEDADDLLGDLHQAHLGGRSVHFG